MNNTPQPCPRCKGEKTNPDWSQLGYEGKPCYFCGGTGIAPTEPNARDTALEERVTRLEQQMEQLVGHIHTVDLLSDMSDPAAETTTPLVDGVNNEGQEIWKQI